MGTNNRAPKVANPKTLSERWPAAVSRKLVAADTQTANSAPQNSNSTFGKSCTAISTELHVSPPLPPPMTPTSPQLEQLKTVLSHLYVYI